MSSVIRIILIFNKRELSVSGVNFIKKKVIQIGEWGKFYPKKVIQKVEVKIFYRIKFERTRSLIK